MRRISGGWLWALSASILLVLFLTVCGGGSNNKNPVGPPATVTLNPASVSLNTGNVFQMTVSVLDAQKRTVLNQTVTFSLSDPRIQISNGGLLCAGTWDSLTAPVVCTPASADAAGIQANLTATAGGITSAAVPVSVHVPIASLEVVADPSPAPSCVAQGVTINFKAIAMGKVNGVTSDITASLGNINWQVQNGQVASASPLTTAGKMGGSDPTTVTAKLPGKTQITAIANTINPVNSVSATFVECPVARFEITPATGPPTVLTGTGATVQMSAKVFDTSGAEITNPVPTVTWISNQPAVTTINTSGLVTGQAAGTSSILAACLPTNCNFNLEPIFSNVAPVTVSGSSSTTVYAASTTGSSVVPITANAGSAPTAGTAINTPGNQMPNSMVFGGNGLRAFLGSTAGLMILDPGTNTFVSNVTTAPGKVLAVSPDGNTVIIADVAANQLRVFNGTNSTVTNFPVSLNQSASLPPAGHFSPDGSKAYVVSGSRVFIVQPGAVSTLNLPAGVTATGVSFLSNGNAAYLAGSSIPRLRTCDNSIVNGPGGTPILVEVVPGMNQVLGVDQDSIDAFTVTITEATGSVATACPTVSEAPPVVHTTGSAAVPNQLIITLDGTKAFVTSTQRTGSLLAYDVANGMPSTIILTGGTAATTTGGATLDSKTLFVGGTDNAVHVIDIVNGADSAPISLTFTPDLVAVRPR